MKLLELLKQELKEWPNNAKAIAQDRRENYLTYLDFDSGFGQWDMEYFYILDELATDHDTAIITKEMWESAKHDWN